MESLKLEHSKKVLHSKVGKLFGQMFFVFVLLFTVGMFFFGLFLALDTGSLFPLVLPLGGGCFLLILCRMATMPVEITETHIIVEHLFWTESLPIANIKKIKISSYFHMIPLAMRAVECESIFIVMKDSFFKYTYYQRLLKEDGAGEFLLNRIEALKDLEAQKRGANESI